MSADLLGRARAGDGDAFAGLVAPYRRELLVHCYRLLGSLDDAEDVLQEVLLAAWRGLAGFAERSSLRGWLYRIATNRCLNARRDARRRPVREPVPPFDPPAPTRYGGVPHLQPFPDALLPDRPDPAASPEARVLGREGVELAFVAALQRLPARQSAVLVLRDVLGFPGGEVAAMLGVTDTAVKAALQRARAAVGADRRPVPADPVPPDLVRRFAERFAADDVDGVVALLTSDAWLAMPPAPHRYRGPAAIAAFLGASRAWRDGRRFHLLPTRANGQPAFGCYLADADGGPARPADLMVLTLDGDRVSAVTRFLHPGVHARFGLPDSLRP